MAVPGYLSRSRLAPSRRATATARGVQPRGLQPLWDRRGRLAGWTPTPSGWPDNRVRTLYRSARLVRWSDRSRGEGRGCGGRSSDLLEVTEIALSW